MSALTSVERTASLCSIHCVQLAANKWQVRVYKGGCKRFTTIVLRGCIATCWVGVDVLCKAGALQRNTMQIRSGVYCKYIRLIA